MPILTIVVVCPAIKGKAPHIPQPKKPKINNFLSSSLNWLKFFFKYTNVKGNNIKKHNVHLQNASEIGGINSVPPLAITKLLAIKIGWINNKKYGIKVLLLLFKNLNLINFYQRRPHKSSLW